jgi:hypothetical protein
MSTFFDILPYVNAVLQALLVVLIAFFFRKGVWKSRTEKVCWGIAGAYFLVLFVTDTPDLF